MQVIAKDAKNGRAKLVQLKKGQTIEDLTRGSSDVSAGGAALGPDSEQRTADSGQRTVAIDQAEARRPSGGVNLFDF
jgi:hypothetical protein